VLAWALPALIIVALGAFVLIVTKSDDPGTAKGFQLVVANQSVDVAPVQVPAAREGVMSNGTAEPAVSISALVLVNQRRPKLLDCCRFPLNIDCIDSVP